MSHDPLKHLSKLLSLVLRHKPEEIGLTLDAQGWASVEELVSKLADRGLTRALLEKIVRESDKQRFAFSPEGQYIRANQGHSLSVDLALQPQTPPDFLYHGTARRHLESIFAQGLSPQARQHVHLSFDISTALAVGRRYDQRPVLLKISAAEMAAAGYTFYCSANGVWLTASVPPAFIHEMDSSDA
ncbi:RNA 2'-phosphotransferase [bacterium (Candidatus Blackallbacteria) CG17_big_fil_post_rev_8_21_14_2_50_48_46]|uniref:Probable RNA 2'-phosphotransferase n=1 Tax=bacterium (Candidatus Blackallbacteria) CG17_big_fil_post_rev_8_21_14_2_50_48_46 TaxID=2014261 RepID=A0A2M7FY40_9BACT|nr:MAG: RNA 2'-phosphotransferase [bacterium (Candidatus Blackallbacteria) CG18_big_fil_WC_8_21_14_2_50_49_26]PIW13940.1 MAG: RNA 2'-phosphotransferase [bacterium (Candidatus Blackallbacteria) CG17_big_fil_post_rev_8_21_14_2_50_48_46]PIW46791.1 MAG: RNA 2'-phosphotransferase [bacterium (Candidatus Blackallbacteria) CG13_big_fil_rev_8_21_14_2_50_49_14]